MHKLHSGSRHRSPGDSTGEAKELLANAKRSHESIVDLISKLPSECDARGYGAKARIIGGVIDEMEKQISAKSPRRCRRRVKHEDAELAAAVRQRER